MRTVNTYGYVWAQGFRIHTHTPINVEQLKSIKPFLNSHAKNVSKYIIDFVLNLNLQLQLDYFNFLLTNYCYSTCFQLLFFHNEYYALWLLLDAERLQLHICIKSECVTQLKSFIKCNMNGRSSLLSYARPGVQWKKRNRWNENNGTKKLYVYGNAR